MPPGSLGTLSRLGGLLVFVLLQLGARALEAGVDLGQNRSECHSAEVLIDKRPSQGLQVRPHCLSHAPPPPPGPSSSPFPDPPCFPWSPSTLPPLQLQALAGPAILKNLERSHQQELLNNCSVKLKITLCRTTVSCCVTEGNYLFSSWLTFM